MPLTVQVFDLQQTLPISQASVKQVVSACLNFHQKTCREVNVYFVEEEEICRLHQEFFGDPSPTDCISFPIDTEQEGTFQILGEIFINPKAALDYAAENQMIDIYEELTLYLVHALLHLLGFDDTEEQVEKEMRQAEKIHLDHLKVHGVYLKPK